MGAEPGILVASRSDRLGARLIAIANTMRLARDYNLGFRVHWLAKWELTDPTDLFDTAFVDQVFMSTQDYRKWRAREAMPLTSFGADLDESRMISWLRSGEGDIEIDTVFDIFRFPNEVAQTVAQSFAAGVDEIPFAAVLRPAMEELRIRLTSGDIPSVAYHIRRGDLISDLQAMNRRWDGKYVPDAFYERHIKTRIGDGSEKLLFSDEPEIIAKFTAQFPALQTFDSLIDTSAMNQAQKDFLELYAMSCCKSIIAPPASAFSRTAATIGNSSISSVEEDLTPDERTEALDTLCDDLSYNLGAFINDGEIGQCLLHAEKHLVSTGRTREFTEIVTSHVERGMCLSFVFAMLFRYLFQNGQYEEILRVRKYVDDGYVYHLRSYAQIALFHGGALMMLGRKQEAIEQISSAFWHEPVEGEISALCYVLLEQGDLSRRNFWFSDPLITRYMSNSWSARYLAENFQPMIDAGLLTVPKKMGSCRPQVWEWSEFTRAHLNKHFRFRGAFKSLIKLFTTRRWHEYEQPNANSFNALAHTREGKLDEALELSQAALTAQPDNALFHKRQSDVFSAMDDLPNAIAHIERAVELQPDARMFHALHGHLLNRRGDLDAASAAYGCSLKDGLLAFPSIYFQAGEINRQRGDLPLATAQVTRGLSLSPTHWRMQTERAEMLEELGQTSEALDTYLRTHRWAHNRLRVTRGLVDLMRREGRIAEAADIVHMTMTKNPDKKDPLKKILEKLRAETQ